jgi:hypothetical protein
VVLYFDDMPDASDILNLSGEFVSSRYAGYDLHFEHGFGLFSLSSGVLINMKTLLVSLVMAALISVGTTGCKKSAPPKSEAITAASADANTAAALNQLTQALRKFSAERKTTPASVDELAASGYVKQMPQAPAGKKFAINGRVMEVVLVDQ